MLHLEYLEFVFLSDHNEDNVWMYLFMLERTAEEIKHRSSNQLCFCVYSKHKRIVSNIEWRISREPWLKARGLFLIHKGKTHPHKTKYFIGKLMPFLSFVGRKRNKIAQTHSWKLVPVWNKDRMLFFFLLPPPPPQELQAVSKCRSYRTDDNRTVTMGKGQTGKSSL